MERHLQVFVPQAWPILEPTPFIPNWHLDAICDHLQAVTDGYIHALLINIPPRHMKSLAVSVFWPVWEWINHPESRWLYASYAHSLAIRDSVKCRRLIDSDWYQRNWGDRFMLTTDQNTKARFDNDRTGCRIATSVGGTATGEGGDRVVVDDPHNVTHRDSDRKRIATLEWWDQTMTTRLNDPAKGAKVIVMQRVHERDLSGHVLSQGGYVHLCLPAEFEPTRRCIIQLDNFSFEDERTEPGALLWPERVGPAQIADFKLRLGPRGYAGQFQQRPAPASGSRFERSWFRYYRKTRNRYELLDHASARVIEIDKCNRFAVMDPAGTEPEQNKRPCYTVIQVWDVTPDAPYEMLLVHQYRKQVQTPEAAEAAAKIVKEFEPNFIGVEKDGLGLGIVQTLKQQGLTVKPIKARGSKEARSETAEIRMHAGQVWFPEKAPYLFDLEHELLHFPLGEFSDQVDALSHAAIYVNKTCGPPGTPPSKTAENENSAMPITQS